MINFKDTALPIVLEWEKKLVPIETQESTTLAMEEISIESTRRSYSIRDPSLHMELQKSSEQKSKEKCLITINTKSDVFSNINLPMLLNRCFSITVTYTNGLMLMPGRFYVWMRTLFTRKKALNSSHKIFLTF
ncbi:hypothetical protein AVEN_48253-1 [Araneus ventricosus]|uniref:Uncharacterized protein n=1 Tax=Araneus ventricosus TaxID=182803 RepID=A0A4Y2IYA2_ARAVE|nr:hypothetical protein AVEN_48253-1 [Araneus ventricosus]